MRISDWSSDVCSSDLLNLRGIAVHIGSQLTSLAPFEAAFKRVGQLVADLRAAGHSITHVDLGGGLGVPYRAGDNILPPSPADYGAMVARVTRSEEHTSELQSLMRISYAVFCMQNNHQTKTIYNNKPNTKHYHSNRHSM